jgi:cytochrome c
MRVAPTLSVPGALVAIGILLAACGPKNALTEAEKAAIASPPTAADKAAILAAMPEPYNKADLTNGMAVFNACRSCHTIVPGGAAMTGPNLFGVFGRKIGSKPGYAYSDAVKAAGFTWDEAHLDKWLTQPKEFLAGTKMSFAGIPSPDDRRDAIAFLKTETSPKPAAP